MTEEDDWEIKHIPRGYSDHALFKSEIGSDPWSDPTLAGLMCINEETLLDAKTALTHWKNVGNDHFSESRRFPARLEDAIAAYTCALETPDMDLHPQLVASIYLNRGLSYFNLSKYTESIRDCKSAIKYDTSNIKAHYRCAKASEALGLKKQALDFCTQGLKICPDDSILVQLRNKLDQDLQEFTRRKIQADLDEANKTLNSKLKIRKLLELRKIHYNEDPLYDLGGAKLEPKLDSQNLLMWPIIFLIEKYNIIEISHNYPEHQILMDLLEVMFPETSMCASWDIDRSHSASKIKIYGQRNSDQRILLNPELTLFEIINQIGVINCCPVFLVSTVEK